MKKLILLITIILFSSCREWDNEYDFRNYLRDKHPYSEIIKIEEFSGWYYEVNDTLNIQRWIYNSTVRKNTIERYKIK